LILVASPCLAIDLFFTPDSANGDVGQSVLVSGNIGASALMRGFTVYMAYDTNIFDLSEPPVAGTLIANHQGLQFNYFDHPAFEPEVLEIGGTIFGTDFWQGPGELFRMRFTLRQCRIEQITAPFAPFFVAADETYPTVTFHPATIVVCPGMPVAPTGLTIFPITAAAVRLTWSSVQVNVLGNPLPAAPNYAIYRQQILPSQLPPVLIVTVADTAYTDNHDTGTAYLYRVAAQITP
jgi:hypothetical protein